MVRAGTRGAASTSWELVVEEFDPIEAWACVVTHYRRIARLRRIWAHLGQFLRQIKQAGRDGGAAPEPGADGPELA